MTSDEKDFYFPFFEKFKILNELLNAHINCREHLILFHFSNFETSYFRLHSENIWDKIYENAEKKKEENIYKYYDSLSQLPFWSLEVNTPGIKKSFLNLLRKSDYENSIYISCYVL